MLCPDWGYDYCACSPAGLIRNRGKWEPEKAGETKYVQNGGMITDLHDVATISLPRSTAEKRGGKLRSGLVATNDKL